PPSGGGSTARASGENAKHVSAATRKARRSRRLLGKLRMGRMVLLSRSFRAYILNLSFFSRCDRSVCSVEKSEGTTGRKGPRPDSICVRLTNCNTLPIGDAPGY